MTYFFQILALGEQDVVAIDSVEFNTLKSAKDTLNAFFTLTENYRVVAEAYRQVERANQEAVLDHIVFRKNEYHDSADVRIMLSTPILGYLASSRYFLDSTDKLLPTIISEDAVKAFNLVRSDIYDSKPEYKFTEALRNYSQHRERPFHGTTFHNVIEDVENHSTSDIDTALSVLADRESLRQDDKFKADALEGMPEKINIIMALRIHMESLWHLHDYLITQHGGIADAARSRVIASIETFKKSTGRSELLGLHAVSQAAADGKFEETIPLLLDWDDARSRIIKRCGNLKNLRRRYATGKIQRDW